MVGCFDKCNKLFARAHGREEKKLEQKPTMSTSNLESSFREVCIQDGVQEINLLSGREDSYRGVIVELKEAMEPNVFAASLKASMDRWRHQVGISGYCNLRVCMMSLYSQVIFIVF